MELARVADGQGASLSGNFTHGYEASTMTTPSQEPPSASRPQAGEARAFPVLFGDPRYQTEALSLGCPRRVPWAFLEPHEAQAQYNHDQSLKRLAERGGLDPCEMLAIVRGEKLARVMYYAKLPTESVVAMLNAELLKWKRSLSENSP